MATRLRYGPRFRNTIVDKRYSYDERLDRDLQRQNYTWAAIRANRTPLQNTLSSAKRTTSGRNAKRVTLPFQPAHIDEREEAENRMKERCKRACELLTFGLTEIMQAPKSEKFRGSPTAEYENLQYYYNLVASLARAANIDPPEFDFTRKPGQKPHPRFCINCNAPIPEGEYCGDCR